MSDGNAGNNRDSFHCRAYPDNLLAARGPGAGEVLMYAGHFAAGLALRGRAPRVPVTVLLVGAFLLDLLWITFGVSHLDKTDWDDWSHSFVLAIFWATLFAAFFWRWGRRAFAVVWLAVISHYVLDLTVQGATYYPNEPPNWLLQPFVTVHYRWFQAVVCLVLMSVFLYDSRREALPPGRVWAVFVIVMLMNFRFLLGV